MNAAPAETIEARASIGSIAKAASTATTAPAPVPWRILVVVPTLGERLETLERTLASIRAQRGVAVDAVLVAKAVTPALAALAERHAARVVLCAGHISAAVNAGFATAMEAHRYVGWLGDDDLLRPGALAAASALLEAKPAAVVACGACDYVDLAGDRLFTRRPPPGAAAWLQFVPGLIKQESCLFRLDAVRRVSGLDVGLKFTMDLDLLLKLRRLGPFAMTDRVLAAFCWHPGSLTIRHREASLDEAQRVQLRHARGLARWLQPLWKHPIRWAILAVARRINRAQPG